MLRLLLLLTVVCSSCTQQAAAQRNVVYTPPAPLTFSTWVGANESWFEYPEQSNSSNYSIPLLLSKPSFGIALSGGGFRAATTGLGYLRGLFLLNLTSQARYLSSNSGGTWLNAAFSFQDKVQLEAFLGAYVPPEQLSLQQMSSPAPEGSFERTIADASIVVGGLAGAVLDTAQGLLPGETPGVGAWSAAVGKAFLGPYDLNSDASTFTAAGTAGPVHQAALAALPPDTVGIYVYRAAAAVSNATSQAAAESSLRPFPVMLGAIMLQETAAGFYATEFTPLYMGVPPVFTNTTPILGGGHVDPQGFNSPPPSPAPEIPAAIGQYRQQQQQQQQQMTALSPTQTGNETTGANITAGELAPPSPTTLAETALNTSDNGSAPVLLNSLLPLRVVSTPAYLVPLKVVIGICSSFLTQLFTPQRSIGKSLLGTESLEYWNQVDFTGAKLPFADGGGVDNLAVTPLLRRRTRKIVVLVAANANITNSSSPDDWAGFQWDVAGLFGACPLVSEKYGRQKDAITGVPVPEFNRRLQVFPREGYAELFNALKNSTAAGGPTHHLASYTVQTNPYQAVFGGWKVDVLWVVNQQQTTWEAALPADTKQELQKSRGPNKDNRGRSDVAADLTGFPLVSTARANYGIPMSRMLSQQATWQLLQLQPQLVQLLQGTSARVAAAPSPPAPSPPASV